MESISSRENRHRRREPQTGRQLQSFLVACLLFLAPCASAFVVAPTKLAAGLSACTNTINTRCSSFSSSSATSLAMGDSSSTSRIGVSVPSQAKCEELGVREWPQQSKSGSWNERVAPDNALTRYVLEGSGKLAVVSGDDDAEQTQQQQQVISIKPGTLVEIKVGTPAVQLEWESNSEVILLTPGFEEGNVFLGVIGGIVILFGVLLSGVLG